MSIKNPYLQKVYQQVCQRDANEPEFLNAVTEVLGTLEPVILRHPEYELYSNNSVHCKAGASCADCPKQASPSGH